MYIYIFICFPQRPHNIMVNKGLPQLNSDLLSLLLTIEMGGEKKDGKNFQEMNLMEKAEVLGNTAICDDSESISSDNSSVSSSSSSDLMEDASSAATSSYSSSSSSSNGPLSELSELMAQLPIKRGLSKYYQGKSQSFTSLGSVKSVGDLAKKGHPYRLRIKTCKSYGWGLESQNKSFSPKANISKKATRGCFLFSVGKRGSTLVNVNVPSPS